MGRLCVGCWAPHPSSLLLGHRPRHIEFTLARHPQRRPRRRRRWRLQPHQYGSGGGRRATSAWWCQLLEEGPYYHQYLRPKTPGGRGFLVSEDAFRAGTAPGQALMIGSSDEITARILDAHDNLGGIDGLYGRVHWGGLPRGLLEASINLLATEIARR